MNRHLLDEVKKRQGLRNDAELARLLELWPPAISKVRQERLPVGPAMMIYIHEATDMSIAEIKGLIAKQDGVPA